MAKRTKRARVLRPADDGRPTAADFKKTNDGFCMWLGTLADALDVPAAAEASVGRRRELAEFRTVARELLADRLGDGVLRLAFDAGRAYERAALAQNAERGSRQVKALADRRGRLVKRAAADHDQWIREAEKWIKKHGEPRTQGPFTRLQLYRLVAESCGLGPYATHDSQVGRVLAKWLNSRKRPT